MSVSKTADGSSNLSTRAKNIHQEKVKQIMNKVSTFITESVDEMKNNVSWPTFQELQKSSVLVLVASLIFALVIGASDFVIKNLMQVIYNL